jgi:hypothetical protein
VFVCLLPSFLHACLPLFLPSFLPSCPPQTLPVSNSLLLSNGLLLCSLPSFHPCSLPRTSPFSCFHHFHLNNLLDILPYLIPPPPPPSLPSLLPPISIPHFGLSNVKWH